MRARVELLARIRRDAQVDGLPIRGLAKRHGVRGRPSSEFLTEREEKACVAIGSNESFSGWTKTFTDPSLCATIVDRLTFNGTIIETGTDSYRLGHIRQQLSMLNT